MVMMAFVCEMVAPPVGAESVSSTVSSGSATPSLMMLMKTVLLVSPSAKVTTRFVGV